MDSETAHQICDALIDLQVVHYDVDEDAYGFNNVWCFLKEIQDYSKTTFWKVKLPWDRGKVIIYSSKASAIRFIKRELLKYGT